MKPWDILLTGLLIFHLLPEIHCAYSNYTLVRTQITNFTDLYVNDFGFQQGLKLNSSDTIYRRYDDSAYSYAELVVGNQSFISNFYNDSDGLPFDGGEADLLQIEIVPPKEASFDLYMNFSVARDRDCREFAKVGQSFYFPYWIFLKTSRGTSIATHTISPNIRRRLCFLEIYKLNKVSTLVSISFTKIIYNFTPNVPPTDDRFVWRRDLELIHLNRPLRFASFYAPTFLSASELEQEDLVRTVAAASSKVSAFKIGSPVSCNNANGNNVNFNNIDCVLVERKPRVFKESVFLQLDRGISLASRFGTLLIIPLNSIMFEINPFSFNRLNIAYESFFNDRTIIEDFKFFINITLNRRNNITGILYKDDPTILGWSLGEHLDRPPTAWVAEISDFIKSVDSNHLLILEFNDVSEILLVPQIDIVLVDLLWNHDECDCPEFGYNAHLFQKVFFVENQYDFKDFLPFIQSCFANSTLGTSGGPFPAGVLANFLGGRTEKNGFHQVKGMRYPGLGDAKERAAFQLISNISAMFREVPNNEDMKEEVLYQPLNYAPRMLWISHLSASTFKFSWFGVVGAVSYELHRSFDDGPFQMRASNISELSSAPEYLESDLPKSGDCDIIVNFRFYGVNEDGSVKSPPMIFNVTIKSASNDTSLKCKGNVPTVSETRIRAEEDKNSSVVIIISVIAVTSVCTISAFLLYYYTRRGISGKMGMKTVGDKKQGKKIISKI